uniref:Uncharacterized protein n=1 Tax=Cucumis sativus TaxID=3659 RepID=A0A0A0L582_CUCSA
MMIGEQSRFNHTIQVPPWDPLDDHHMTGISSPVFISSGVDSFIDSFSSIHRYLPSAADSDELDGQSPRTPVSADSVDGSSRIAHAFDSYFSKGSFVTSPTSILSTPPVSPPSDSPPLSPNCPFNSVNGLVSCMRNLQLGKLKATPHWGRIQLGQNPLSPSSSGLYNLPSTPTTGNYELWGKNYEEEPAMERVESGRDLRAQMYAKLSKDNSVKEMDPILTPDVGWVSELLM